MADSFEIKGMLTEALRLLDQVDLPANRVLECTNKLLVNPERAADDLLGKMDFVNFYAFDPNIGDNKLIIAFRLRNDHTTATSYAIIDCEAGSYTPMTIDEFFDFFAEPKSPDYPRIEQIVARVLELANLKSIFHPSTSR